MPADPENEKETPVGAGDSSRHETKRMLNSVKLFAGQTEVLIEHNTEVYRLRITRNGKLILQK
jgi:hemin uptake protein HemP